MEAKTDIHAEFDKIMADPAYKQKLGLVTNKDIYEHLGISNMTFGKWKSGDFNIRDAFLKDHKKIWDAFMEGVKQGKISPGLFRTFAQLANELVEKREDTLTVVSTADRIKIARELRDGLRREWEDAGSCPVCHQSKALCHEICDNPKSKFSEDREVATLGLPAGFN